MGNTAQSLWEIILQVTMCFPPMELPSFHRCLWMTLLKNQVLSIISRKAAEKIHKDVEQFAASEQLTAHAQFHSGKIEDEE